MIAFLMRVGSWVSRRAGRGGRLMSVLRPAYERLLGVAARGRGVPWVVNGEQFQIDPRVRRLVSPHSEPELWEYAQGVIRRGDHVLDIGSFLGIHAVKLARLAGPQGRVVCVEPTPTSVAVLQRHLRMNRLADRVSLVQGGVGAQSGTAALRQFSDPFRNQVQDRNHVAPSASMVEIRILTIDEICAAHGLQPKFIRMDIQGAEYEALLGARETIRGGRGSLHIVVEVHPQEWGKFGYDASAFDALLKELGLRAVPLVAHQSLYQPDAEVRLEYA